MLDIVSFSMKFPGPPVFAKRTMDYTFEHVAQRLMFARQMAESVQDYDRKGPIFPVEDGKGNVVSTKA